jgi:hypothetical protein
MKSGILFLLFAAPFLFAQEPATRKPTVFISGSGITTIQASGVGAGAHGVGGAAGSATVGKTDAAMQLSRGLLKDCPNVALTLDSAVVPDYYMSLNVAARGGFIITAEFSQLMVADASKAPMFSEQGSTGKLMKHACKAIVANWQAKTPAPAEAKTPLWNIQKP